MIWQWLAVVVCVAVAAAYDPDDIGLERHQGSSWAVAREGDPP